jgi:YHS domain-containing protein
MARLILWIVLIALAGRALSRLFRGVLEGAGYQRGSGKTPSVGLVRDPVCGVFVVPARALTTGTGSQTRYFCSEKCRRQWSKR